jgi:hypothetical protein
MKKETAMKRNFGYRGWFCAVTTMLAISLVASFASSSAFAEETSKDYQDMVVIESLTDSADVPALGYIAPAERATAATAPGEDFEEDPWEGFNVVVERMMLPYVRPIYETIAQRYVPNKTIVVAPPTALGARVAHEKLGVPLATIHLAPAPIQSVYLSPVLPPMMTGDGVPRWLRRLQFRMVNNWMIDRKLAAILKS